MRRITILERAFRAHDWEPARAKMPPFFRHAYAPSTLRQILYLRETLRWRDSSVDTMIAALMLGALHGESGKSSSYLSNQMPRVISTKPAYSIRFWQKHGLRAPKRDAFALLRNRAEFRYETGLPRTEQVWTYCTDMRELPATLKTLAEPIRCVITSPPYLDVTSFEEDQWLRLWFLGGMRKPTRGRLSKDDRHESPACYWNFISDMWRVFGQSLSKKAQIVIRLGGKGTSAQQAVEGLKATSLFSGRKVRLVSSEISEIARRQTHSFRPGSKGCRLEVDCHFQMA